jgi:hypothetical protein
MYDFNSFMSLLILACGFVVFLWALLIIVEDLMK